MLINAVVKKKFMIQTSILRLTLTRALSYLLKTTGKGKKVTCMCNTAIFSIFFFFFNREFSIYSTVEPPHHSLYLPLPIFPLLLPFAGSSCTSPNPVSWSSSFRPYSAPSKSSLRTGK